MINDKFFPELNTAIHGILRNLQGREVSEDLFDELTEQLNIIAKEVYDRYNVPFIEPISRNLLIYYFNLLIENGAVEIRYQNNSELASEYSHLNDVKGIDTKAHHSYLQDDANLYDPVGSEGDRFIGKTIDEIDKMESDSYNYIEDNLNRVDRLPPDNNENNPLPLDWGNNLVGNMDASYWAKEFGTLLHIKPEWLNDLGYLTSWFANAIMTGYDVAKQAEYPIKELGPNDYIYLEFYDFSTPLSDEHVEVTLKFYTLDAAKAFLKLNGYGSIFTSRYYRFYQYLPTTYYEKTEIK